MLEQFFDHVRFLPPDSMSYKYSVTNSKVLLRMCRLSVNSKVKKNRYKYVGCSWERKQQLTRRKRRWRVENYSTLSLMTWFRAQELNRLTEPVDPIYLFALWHALTLGWVGKCVVLAVYNATYVGPKKSWTGFEPLPLRCGCSAPLVELSGHVGWAGRYVGRIQALRWWVYIDTWKSCIWTAGWIEVWSVQSLQFLTLLM